MARQRFDIGSKRLLHNQGKGILLVGGFKGVRHIDPMPGEIAQSRKYPDGLLRVFLEGERKPHHVLIEVATYAEKRALKQALDDLTLAYSVLAVLSARFQDPVGEKSAAGAERRKVGAFCGCPPSQGNSPTDPPHGERLALRPPKRPILARRFLPACLAPRHPRQAALKVRR